MANVGDFSHAIRSIGLSVKAIEPHPEAVAYMRKRFKNDSKVKKLEASVCQSEGVQNLHLHPDHTKNPIKTILSASQIPDKFNQKSEYLKVKQIEFRYLLGKLNHISLLKMDIEEFEMYLIEDIINYSDKIEKLRMETHHKFMSKSIAERFYNMQIEKLESFIKGTNRQKLGKQFGYRDGF